jgi:DHA3 family macrolide efflux protein-like MFS transporter
MTQSTPINNKNYSWQKKIALFLTSQTISLLGSSIVAFAIIWYVTLTTASGLMLTLSTLSNFLPQIVISLFAGVWADRYNRKHLIIFADLLIALTTLILAIFFFLGFKYLWLLFLASGIRSLGAGIQTPAVNALIPQIVPEHKLMKINGINGSIQSLAFIVAPAISGGVLAAFSLEYTFIIDILTAIIGVSLLSFISIPRHKIAIHDDDRSSFDDLKEGLIYIWNHSFIKTLFLFYALIMFFITPAAFLTPLLITRSYGTDVWRLTVNEIFFSGGTMLSGLFLAFWGGYKRRIKTISFGCIVFGLSIFFLGIAPNFVIYILFFFIAGFSIPFLTAPTTVLIQECVNPEIQGRVFSILQMIATTALPLGMIIFGPLCDIIKIELLLIVSGLIMALLGVMIIFNKTLKKDLL